MIYNFLTVVTTQSVGAGASVSSAMLQCPAVGRIAASQKAAVSTAQTITLQFFSNKDDTTPLAEIATTVTGTSASVECVPRSPWYKVKVTNGGGSAVNFTAYIYTVS